MAKILLGVGAGIAAYKAAELVRELQKAGHQVRVMMTQRATQFVGPLTFAGLIGEPTAVDLFDPALPPMTHIELSRWADLLILAPATADVLAKLANGLADDLLSTQALAFRGPVLAAPAMNTAMWEHPAVQANLATLQARGVQLVLGAAGELACGEVGAGRLAEPAEIAAAAERLLTRGRDLVGWQVLVTAGGTIAPIDPVRFIGNPSTGRMGLALAERAAKRGASVTLVIGATAQAQLGEFDLRGISIVPVTTTADLFEAVSPLATDADLVLAAAAPADYAVATPSRHKLKKGAASLRLDLVATPDVLAEVGARRRPEQILVGFAAETEDLLANARAKLVSKRLDAIVVNDVGRPDIGFASRENEVYWVTAHQAPELLPKADKREVADGLLDRVMKLRQGPPMPAGPSAPAT